MNQRSQILRIEISMVDRSDLDLNQIIQPLNIYQTARRNYFSIAAINRIISAIIEIVLQLGSNYRHPLYFDVQVLPGEQINISDVFFDNFPFSRRYRRIQ